MNPFSKEEKKFSLILPIYKTWKHLEVCLTYLDEQDYKNFEIIGVFDGHDKKGEAEMDRLIKKFKNLDIRYIVIKHGGAPKARNAGVPLATGDFYSFLDPDSYLYPGTLREWANAFDAHPEIDVVWGIYDLNTQGVPYHLGGGVPCDNSGRPVYWAFRYSNYCSGTFPVRKEAFLGWDESLKSLQDWDLNIRMLKKTNFEGTNYLYIPKAFFITEDVRPGGISRDSFDNWLERRKTVMDKNGIPQSEMCVTSYGAPYHGVNVARMLGAEYLPDPQWRPHNYKTVYLIGSFCGTSDQTAVGQWLFRDFKGKKIVHWIGSDVYQLRNNASFEALKLRKARYAKEKYIMLTEYDHTYKEMKEVGIETKIVPIPPKRIFRPMPLPEKFTIGIYENPNSTIYKNEIVPELARVFHDVDFKLFGDPSKVYKEKNVEHLGYIDVEKLMPSLSCNLRMVVHDGLSLTSCEFLTAGRHVITNMDLKYAIKSKLNFDSVVEAIKRAQKTPIDPKASKYWTRQLDQQKYKDKIWSL